MEVAVQRHHIARIGEQGRGRRVRAGEEAAMRGGGGGEGAEPDAERDERRDRPRARGVQAGGDGTEDARRGVVLAAAGHVAERARSEGAFEEEDAVGFGEDARGAVAIPPAQEDVAVALLVAGAGDPEHAGDAVAPHRQQIGGAGGDGRAVGYEAPAREPGIESAISPLRRPSRG